MNALRGGIHILLLHVGFKKITLWRDKKVPYLFLILQIGNLVLRRRPLNKVCLVLAPPEIRGDGPPLSEGREAAAGGLGGDQGGEAAAQPGHQAPQGVQEGPASLLRPLQPAAAQYLMCGLAVTFSFAFYPEIKQLALKPMYSGIKKRQEKIGLGFLRVSLKTLFLTRPQKKSFVRHRVLPTKRCHNLKKSYRNRRINPVVVSLSTRPKNRFESFGRIKQRTKELPFEPQPMMQCP